MGQQDPAELPRYSRDSGSQRYSAARKKGNAKKKAVLAVVIVVVALLAVAGIAVASFLNRVNNNIAIDQQSLEELKEQLVAPQQPDEPYYTLLIGSDSREAGDFGRSDTIILMRLILGSTSQLTLHPPRYEIQLEGYGTQKDQRRLYFGGQAGA